MSLAQLAATHERRYAQIDRLACQWPRDPNGWLTPAEQRERDRFRDDRRRQAWLAGRWLAKGLIAEVVPQAAGAELVEIEILSRRADGKADRPRPALQGQRLEPSLSISHEANGVLAVLAASDAARGVLIGCDLVAPAAMPARFCQVWFGEEERHWLAGHRPEMASLAWGVKEAVYKAGNRGESFVPRHVSLAPPRQQTCTAQLFHCQAAAQRDEGEAYLPPVTHCVVEWQAVGTLLAVVALTQPRPSTR